MKSVWMIVVLSLALCGCGSVQTFETLGQVEHEAGEQPAVGQIYLTLPQEAAALVPSQEGGTLYDCGKYTLSLQTLPAGDIAGTVRSVCGFASDKLTVLRRDADGKQCYEWVWTAAGEGGDVMCRAMVLDDGAYHYCLCAMAQADSAGVLQEQWAQVFATFAVN